MFRRNVTASLLLAASLAGLFALSPRAAAHHNYAIFDKSRLTTVNGTISKIEWRNPHTYLFVSVIGEGGSTRQYMFEASSPNLLKRFGWKVNSVKVGDRVSLEIFPLLDGRPGGLLYALTLPNGTVLKGN